MLARARMNLEGISNVRLHLAMGGSIDDIPQDEIDFVYSYAALSKLANRNDVFEQLLEIWRVMRPGALARLHFNGLIQVRGSQYDSWDGIRFSGMDLLEFTARNGFQVLALEGAGTPDFWTTWIKREEDWAENVAIRMDHQAQIRRVRNTVTGDPLVPSHGPYASIAIQTERLPAEAGLHHLRVTVGGELGIVTYIGPMDARGQQTVLADMPANLSRGLHPVQLHWRHWPDEVMQPLSEAVYIRVIAPAPAVPRIVGVTDAANPSLAGRVASRRARLTLEGATRMHELEVTLDGVPVEDLDREMTDPRTQRYQVTFPIPRDLSPGTQEMHVTLGQRRLPPVQLEILS
jgi:hypothetical protein